MICSVERIRSKQIGWGNECGEHIAEVFHRPYCMGVRFKRKELYKDDD